MASESISKGWRDKGNYSYRNFKQSNDDGRRKSYLESALRAYYRAFETAVDADEKSSAAKNYGIAAWNLANVEHALGMKEAIVEFRFREAIKFFSKATAEGSHCKPAEWLSDLSETYGTCVNSAVESVTDYQYKSRLAALENHLNAMCEESQKAPVFFEMATVMCQAGCAALGSKDFISALQAFHDCYRPIQECFRLTGGEGHIFTEALVIEEDVRFHMSTAEALQAIKIGDDTLKAAVENSEILEMTLVYDAMDLYKRAVVSTREVEVEMEAIAVSRLGSLFGDVLKMKSKAKDYYKLCIQLAASLQPRNFSSESWYTKATEALQRYQAEAVDNDETERQAERDKYLKELAPELKDIEAADVGSSPIGLLKHIYNKYPPKNPEHKLEAEGLDDDDRKKMKRLLLQALLHYHPDKQDISTHGMRWSILCYEICKTLNKRHDRYKCPD